MNQWFNPFMPYRFINPRSAGLIVFKGGGGSSKPAAQPTPAATATTTAAAVAAPEPAPTPKPTPSPSSTPKPQPVSNAGSSGGGTRTIIQKIDTSDLAKSDAMDRGFMTSEANQGRILSDTGNILNNTNTLMDTTGNIEANSSQLLDQSKVLEQGMGNLNQSVDQGFASVGSDLSSLSTNVDEGFTGVGTQLNDLSGSVNTQFDNLNTNVSDGFSDLENTTTSGFANQADTLNTLSANVLQGQGSLQEYLEGMSGRQDTYFGGLSEGQAALQGQVGGLQDNFTQFERNYSDDTTLANQMRADLANQVTGGFDRLRDDVENTQQLNTAQNARLASGNQALMQGQVANQAEVAAAMRSSTAQEQPSISSAELVDRLGTIRQVIASEGQNLEPQTAMQFAKFADSFDGQGQLIRRSQDGRGNTVQRAIDAQNNLNLATFNSEGGLLAQDRINIPEIISVMDALGYQPRQSTTGIMAG